MKTLFRRAVVAVKWLSPKNKEIRKEVRIAELSERSLERKTPAKNIREFGKKFITSFVRKEVLAIGDRKVCIKATDAAFESPVAASLVFESEEIDKTLGQAKINFERNTVIIEAIQGRRGENVLLKRIFQETGKKWGELLLESVEEQARTNGFHEIKIRRPETLYWYQNPTYGKPKQVQAEIRALYYGLAKKMGYRKEKGFFVKEL